MSIPCYTTRSNCGTIPSMESRSWALANFLRDEMNKRGWSQKDLAAKSGVPESTLSNLLNNKTEEPGLATLTRLSTAFEVPLWRLILIAGYPVGTPDSFENQQSRLVELSKAFPWLTPVAEDIAGLTPDDRESLLTVLEMLLRRKKA
jgi:transcriptional regulator with XRE-family HTH domain